MPLLFGLAIHKAPQEAQEHLLPEELLLALLDDVYVVAGPDRIRAICNMLEAKLCEKAAIRFHTEKTRTWNKGGQRAPDMEDLGPEVWNREGVKILGTPLGSDAHTANATTARLEEEARLWEAISWVTHNVLGKSCFSVSVLVCHHLLRTVPPSQSRFDGEGHDEGMWHAAESVLGRWPGTAAQQATARQIATLPMRLRGRSRAPVSKADGTRRVLGFLGGRVAHALSKIAHFDRSDRRAPAGTEELDVSSN